MTNPLQHTPEETPNFDHLAAFHGEAMRDAIKDTAARLAHLGALADGVSDPAVIAVFQDALETAFVGGAMAEKAEPSS